MSEKIRECPFCGYKGIHSPIMIVEKEEAPSREKGFNFSTTWRHLVCLKCKSKTGEYKTEEEAIAAWNRRAGE